MGWPDKSVGLAESFISQGISGSKHHVFIVQELGQGILSTEQRKRVCKAIVFPRKDVFVVSFNFIPF